LIVSLQIRLQALEGYGSEEMVWEGSWPRMILSMLKRVGDLVGQLAHDSAVALERKCCFVTIPFHNDLTAAPFRGCRETF
jgi:hypothetical protein